MADTQTPSTVTLAHLTRCMTALIIDSKLGTDELSMHEKMDENACPHIKYAAAPVVFLLKTSLTL
jgi:hypothetical protein